MNGARRQGCNIGRGFALISRSSKEAAMNNIRYVDIPAIIVVIIAVGAPMIALLF